MNAVEVWAWGEKIGIVVQEGKQIYFELDNKKHRRISPLLFEETSVAKTILFNDDDIYKIGPISDAIPSGYGMGYLSKYFTDEFGRKPSVVESLSFVGKHALGALEFRPENSASKIDDELYSSLKELKTQSRKIYEGEHTFELAKLIAVSNSAAGGAKAKAVVGYNSQSRGIHIAQKYEGEPDGYRKCIIKFNPKSGSAKEEYNNEIKAEYLYSMLAAKVGVKMSNSWLIEESGANYFITERFDSTSSGERKHLHSLAGIFGHDASSFTMGYESLFRAGNMLSVPQDDKEQMFKTMLFNLVFSNRDDHSRNFSFLMDKHGEWRYAPAYDLTFSVHNYGANAHQLTINKRPAHQVRSIGINKVAKLCDITDPLGIMAEMIAIKHDRLETLAKETGLPDDFAGRVFGATADVDKTFGK